MQDQELTGWFELSEQKPWEPGVYEVEFKSVTSDTRIGKSYFDGYGFNFLSWSFHNYSIDVAYKNRHNKGGGDLVKKWRGLASDPNAKPKTKRSGNPKVTRYVVIDVMKGEPVASFHTRDAAVDYAERMAWPRIKRVRHRSPE